ncbi:hypothetical protein FACS1894140_5300 [Spirochaetia bacterium]|nr:hypothetical protein FACS1894140_5300 [Spirochaetia bacterium]
MVTTGNLTEDGDAEEYVIKNDAGEVVSTGWRVKADAEEKATGESVIPEKLPGDYILVRG